ncbi:hypothetical protein [Mariniflexile sp. HMF6888]|uniref:hypothetical protein n=1 Tax=Mariniflexile sp. HMF6888 TaxID=3373086 RepID=UPI0037A000CE
MSKLLKTLEKIVVVLELKWHHEVVLIYFVSLEQVHNLDEAHNNISDPDGIFNQGIYNAKKIISVQKTKRVSD